MRLISCIICVAVCGVSLRLSAKDAAGPKLYDLVLLSTGDSKEKAIDAVRGLSGCDLEQATFLVESLPKPILAGIAKSAGEGAVRTLEAVQCKVEWRDTGVYSVAEIFAVGISRRLEWPAGHRKDGYWIFNNPDAKQFAGEWKDDGGKLDELPKVDWKVESVIALFLDAKKTHGHGIKVESVFYCGDAEAQRLTALYRETKDGAKSAVAGDAVVIRKMELGRDGFFTAVDLDSDEGKTLTQRRDLKSGIEKPDIKKEDK